jgi:hypothetical protein
MNSVILYWRDINLRYKRGILAVLVVLIIVSITINVSSLSEREEERYKDNNNLGNNGLPDIEINDIYIKHRGVLEAVVKNIGDGDATRDDRFITNINIYRIFFNTFKILITHHSDSYKAINLVSGGELEIPIYNPIEMPILSRIPGYYEFNVEISFEDIYEENTDNNFHSEIFYGRMWVDWAFGSGNQWSWSEVD